MTRHSIRSALLNTQLEAVVCANVVRSDFEGSVHFFSVQKLNRIPVSILLPGIAAVGCLKKGDVRTPENPIGFM
jgi:hypothetical protein